MTEKQMIKQWLKTHKITKCRPDYGSWNSPKLGAISCKLPVAPRNNVFINFK